jgi:hypothetical protein
VIAIQECASDVFTEDTAVFVLNQEVLAKA